jgi:hypothetical protein
MFRPVYSHLQVHNNSETDSEEDNVYVVVLIKTAENKDRHHIGATAWFQHCLPQLCFSTPLCSLKKK